MGFSIRNAFMIALAIIAISDAQSIDSSTAINGTDVDTETSLLTPNVNNTASPEPTLAVPVVDDQDKTDDNLKKGINSNNKKAFVEEKGLKLFRWSKERDYRFPIRPPKLRKSNSTEKVIQKSRIGYASALQTREIPANTNSNQTSTPIRKMRKIKRKRLLSTNNRTNVDIFELQSSDHSPSFAFFAPKRIASKSRINGQILYGTVVSKPSNETRKRIPKLLLPKSLRPAMYSLDGFVPRPSLNRIITSTASPLPLTEKQIKFAQSKLAKVKQINKIRRYGLQRNAIEERNDKKDDIETSDSRRRNVITRRKSVQSLITSDSIAKPTVNKLSKDKRKGIPGKDFPTLASVPRTGFDCKDLNNGVYADLETGCQVWHVCQNRYKHSFLCPNGTIFNERNGICDWWYNHDCPKLVKLTDKDDSDMDSIKMKLNEKRAKSKRSHRFAA